MRRINFTFFQICVVIRPPKKIWYQSQAACW
jgi:hypothetical protein